MFTTITLPELATKVAGLARQRADFVADTSAVRVKPATEHGGFDLSINGARPYRVNDHAHRQLGERLRMRGDFYSRLRFDHPDLLATNVNTLFEREPAKRLFRMLGDHSRAVLSNTYRCIDNEPVLNLALDTLASLGHEIEIASCEVTERRLYLKAIFPRMEGEVKQGDVVQGGVIIANSEIGDGAYSVKGFLRRCVCDNGMIVSEDGQRYRRTHLGRRLLDEDATMIELYQSDTIEADDAALHLKMRDMIVAAANETHFRHSLEAMREATKDSLGVNAHDAAGNLVRELGIREAQRGDVLTTLMNGGDMSRYGFIQAVTDASKRVDNYDLASDMEAIGGNLLAMSPKRWKAITEAPASKRAAEAV